MGLLISIQCLCVVGETCFEVLIGVQVGGLGIKRELAMLPVVRFGFKGFGCEALQLGTGFLVQYILSSACDMIRL